MLRSPLSYSGTAPALCGGARIRWRLLAVRVAFAFCLAATAVSAVGCCHVKPYQREQLAKPTMDTGAREQMRNRFYAHVYDAREGAMGSTDSAGGGCGCN